MTTPVAMSAPTVAVIAIARTAKSFSVRGWRSERGTENSCSHRGSRGHVVRQVVNANQRSLSEDDRALDDMLQLADVARPREVDQSPERLWVEGHDRLPVLRRIFLQEILGHQRNVGRPLSEGGHGKHQRVDAEVQVFAQ